MGVIRDIGQTLNIKFHVTDYLEATKELKRKMYMSRIVIDGNIGSGKTTQLDLLEKKGWRVQREPLDKWPLKEFYENPSRWAFYFHMVLLQTLQPKETKSKVVYERSLLSSRYVFWPVMMNRKMVTKMEDETYAEFYTKYEWFPDLYIFLKKRPEKCYEHIQKRGQAGDKQVTLDYLKELDTQYAKMIKNIQCKVIIIDAECSAEEIQKEICKYIGENELFVSYPDGKEVYEEGRTGRKMQCSSVTDVCRVS
jgi:deoxyadenosine/deoxycytidine kinase